jgi:hypothetical protein
MTAQANPADPSARALILRVARTYVGPHWFSLAIAFTCAALGAGLTFLLTWMLKPFLNDMHPGVDFNIILRTAGYIVAIGLGRGLALIAQVRICSTAPSAPTSPACARPTAAALSRPCSTMWTRCGKPPPPAWSTGCSKV